jgi:hypothetical protein
MLSTWLSSYDLRESIRLKTPDVELWKLIIPTYYHSADYNIMNTHSDGDKKSLFKVNLSVVITIHGRKSNKNEITIISRLYLPKSEYWL